MVTETEIRGVGLNGTSLAGDGHEVFRACRIADQESGTVHDELAAVMNQKRAGGGTHSHSQEVAAGRVGRHGQDGTLTEVQHAVGGAAAGTNIAGAIERYVCVADGHDSVTGISDINTSGDA